MKGINENESIPKIHDYFHTSENIINEKFEREIFKYWKWIVKIYSSTINKGRIILDNSSEFILHILLL